MATDDCYCIVGACYILEFMDKEALVGPLQLSPGLSDPTLARWFCVLNGRVMMMYLNGGVPTEEVPRLGPLPPGRRISEDTVSSKDLPKGRRFLRRQVGDSSLVPDPRHSSEALKAMGVTIKTFTLM